MTVLAKIFRRSLPRSMAIGIVATLVDLLVLFVMIQLWGLPPDWANIPSLLAGSFVQFLGNRYVSFRHAKHGDWIVQMFRFAMAEAASLILNAVIFQVLITYTSWNYLIVRLIGTTAVFLGLSYPLWRMIFRVKHPPVDKGK